MSRLCAGGCGEAIADDNKNGYKWGHKNGCNPPRTSLAKVDTELVIDQPEPEADDAEIYVSCEISTTQLDTIYHLLQPHQKALAVLNALNADQE